MLILFSSLMQYGQVLTKHVANKDLTDFGEKIDSDCIYQRDLSWLHEADKVVAEVTIPSLGVGYELAKAEDIGKPILCIYRSDSKKSFRQ